MKLNPQQTADALPYPLLAQEIERLLGDTSVVVPPRLVQRMSDQSSLFVMPASDAKLAITKLITWVADNPSRGLPAIQGEVMVFDVRDGRLLCSLDGPTVTAHRTAAVSLLAAKKLAPNPAGKLLLVWAGVQARAHLQAFVNGLGVREVVVSSRTRASAQALVDEAHSMGLQARVADNPNHALADCSLVVSTTSAQEVSMYSKPREDAFVCAIGAFTPAMLEWAPEVCVYMAQHGQVFVDTRDADHEAGDLLQAGLEVATFPTLQALVRGEVSHTYANTGPVFFKSCGWAGWDLAAARCVVRSFRLEN
jgi:ornithine cyclodeaminase